MLPSRFGFSREQCTSGLPPLPLLPPHWFSTKRSHDSLFHSQMFPYLQQIHTQALAKNRTHLQQSPHILPPHRSNTLNLSHSAIFSSHHLYRTSVFPIICPGHSRGSKTEKFLGVFVGSNWGFSDGGLPKYPLCYQL